MKMKKVKESAMKGLLPFPSNDANKYTRGKLTLVGGSHDYPGAVCLAGSAALMCGSGYVEVVCDESSVPIAQACNCNLVVRGWSTFSCSALRLDVEEEGHPQACLIGSGFAASGEIEAALLEETVKDAACPLLVDGGALGILATTVGPKAVHNRFANGRSTVLTPHFGEASRLAVPVGCPVPKGDFRNLEEHAFFAQAISMAYGAIVALKGPVTLIASPVNDGDPKVFVMDKGSSCLAKAGTGDVLAGMTASFLSQGMDPLSAVKLSTFTHARSATLAERELTAISVCASDVVDHIPNAFKSYM